jgi:hypothetical protein
MSNKLVQLQQACPAKPALLFHPPDVMSDLKQDLSLDGTQSVHADTSDTDQIKDQNGDTDYVNSNGPGAEKAAKPALQWGSDAPDGGLIAWGVILGLWCTAFCSFGWLSSTFTLLYVVHH